MTVKETAGKILLVLYYIQTENPAKLEIASIIFTTMGDIVLETDTWLKALLEGITKNNKELYNGFNYLLGKGLIAKKNNRDMMGGIILLGVHLTPSGIDIIENVEQGEEPQKIFKSLFNLSFNFSPNVKVGSLLKAEVGNIVGIGGAINGKLSL
jgi:hypothetical protein